MDILALKKNANEIRKGIVTAVYSAKSGHPGGSLSAADILTYLYFEELNIDPKDPKKADRDPPGCPAFAECNAVTMSLRTSFAIF